MALAHRLGLVSSIGFVLLTSIGCSDTADDGSSSSASTTAASGGGEAAPRIQFFETDTSHQEVSRILVSDQVELTVSGVDPNASVKVTATMTGWQSWATFQADASGHISTVTDPPTEGTYDEADTDGLFWSMAKVDASATFADLDVHFTAEVDGAVVAETDLSRDREAPDLVKTTLTSDTGLVGIYYTPAEPGPHPVIIGFGGSEGGLYFGQIIASTYASQGYAVLGLAYFGEDGLPATLTDVPLEYFGTALDWVAAQPDADIDRVAVMGASRGGELALLLGATYPEIKAVVAMVPSGLVWGSTASFTDFAWTEDGTGVPYVPTDEDAQPSVSTAPDGKKVYAYAPTFDASIAAATPEQIALATIHVEETSGPVLMLAGAADQLWPSCKLAQISMDRLTAMGHATANPLDQLVCYPDSGHFTNPTNVGFPMTTADMSYVPALHGYEATGGTPKGIARAARQSFDETQSFLTKALQ